MTLGKSLPLLDLSSSIADTGSMIPFLLHPRCLEVLAYCFLKGEIASLLALCLSVGHQVPGLM